MTQRVLFAGWAHAQAVGRRRGLCGGQKPRCVSGSGAPPFSAIEKLLCDSLRQSRPALLRRPEQRILKFCFCVLAYPSLLHHYQRFPAHTLPIPHSHFHIPHTPPSEINMSVVGVDLGTLNSVIAVARNRGVDVVSTIKPSYFVATSFADLVCADCK